MEQKTSILIFPLVASNGVGEESDWEGWPGWNMGNSHGLGWLVVVGVGVGFLGGWNGERVGD